MQLTRTLFNSVKRFATTGLTGLAPVENPKPLLMSTYKKTLDVLAQMPSHAVYRQATESLTRHRLEVVSGAEERPAAEQGGSSSSGTLTTSGSGGGALPEVEAQLEDGLVEEILATAEAELVLAERMLQWKPWEALEEPVPEGQWVRYERK